MSYTPTTWAAGDTVTSAKLNKIEQGIVTASNNSGVFVVEMDGKTSTLEATAGEIYQAFKDGKIIYIHLSSSSMDAYFGIGSMHVEESGFMFFAMSAQTTIAFTANSENDYPVLDQTPAISQNNYQ